ncbi:MAG: peptide chain release factor 1 [Lactobacillaceae bacterium]|jgi:peptide chain release factor 1|nr:peptide chain release factor 1 [Lactobacillaceae bacterium]
MDSIYEKLQTVVDRVDEINSLLSDPEVIADSKRFTDLSKELANLAPSAEAYLEYKKVTDALAEAHEMLGDADLGEIAKSEIDELTPKKSELEERMKILMLPKDPNDDKNIIFEIRGSEGGDEANIFAGDLFDMYRRYAESQGWKIDVIDDAPGTAGGFSQITFLVTGDSVYSKLKFEMGGHRVQRIPETESKGRVHTSLATVSVMPEFEETPGLTFDDIKNDVREDVFRSGGAGGQNVNKVSTGIRLTHEPSGLVVRMTEERTQYGNREKAQKLLVSRLYELEASKNESEYAEARKTGIGTGARGDKVRTYNYPQDRVTDHRLGENFALKPIMKGDMDKLISALVIADQTARLEEINND